MEFIEEPTRKTPVTGEYEVVVVGGGVAGIAAAIASARNGTRTALIEQSGFLGGTATAGLMASINGFRNQKKPNHVQTVRGIAQELILRMHQLGGVYTKNTAYGQEEFDIDKGELPYSIAFDPEVFIKNTGGDYE